MEQARRFDVDIRCDRVLAVHPEAEGFRVKTEEAELEACAVILAAGVSRVKPGIDNLSDYAGDGFFYRGREVMVVGEGVFAANQALELLQYTPKVTISTQGKTPDITQPFREQLKEAGIAILEKKITSLEGDGVLERVVFDDGERRDAEGLFVAMGQAGAADFAASLGLVKNGVFIEADDKQQTNVPGVFAAGDCVGRFLQISVAVGEGAIAARSAIKYAKKNCAK